MWLILGRAAAKLPVWVYAILVLLVAVGVAGMHIIGQRNEARKSLLQAQERIEQLARDNATLAGNNASLEAGIATQRQSIDRAAAEAKRRQAETDKVLAALEFEAREQAAKAKAWKTIQEQGNRSEGANYAFDARRALRK